MRSHTPPAVFPRVCAVRLCLQHVPAAQSEDGSATASDRTEVWKNGESWYFDQQDWLEAQCKAQRPHAPATAATAVKQWTWTAWRPPAIIGFAPGAPVSAAPL
jgi:hypothetical protein